MPWCLMRAGASQYPLRSFIHSKSSLLLVNNYTTSQTFSNLPPLFTPTSISFKPLQGPASIKSSSGWKCCIHKPAQSTPIAVELSLLTRT